MYAKLRKSLKSKGSSKHRSKPSASPLPSADSVPSSQPSAIAHMQTQVDSLNTSVNTLSESLLARMDALQASLVDSSVPRSSSPTRLGKDTVPPQPGQTAGESRMFQALGVGSRTFGVNAQFIVQDGSAPRQELLALSAAQQLYAALGAATQPSATFTPQLHAAPSHAPPATAAFAPQLHAAPGPAPQPSAHFAPPQPPPRFEDPPPPQPSTSGWVPSGPPPPGSCRGSRDSLELEASDAESEVSARDSASARLAELIYDVCPASRPLSDDARQPCCDFEGWFGQPEFLASRHLFRLYPRVKEVEARVEALARRSKPLSQILLTRSRSHVVADQPLFASSLVNPSFAQFAGVKAVGSKH